MVTVARSPGARTVLGKYLWKRDSPSIQSVKQYLSLCTPHPRGVLIGIYGQYRRTKLDAVIPSSMVWSKILPGRFTYIFKAQQIPSSKQIFETMADVPTWRCTVVKEEVTLRLEDASFM